ncbi:hypothetical protein ACNH6B_04985 [Shewanella basaltis]|uniref:hypothetical protein n=1 Tax=Shewanella basaltis TaxID=472183 RepID=UPI003AAAD4D6
MSNNIISVYWRSYGGFKALINSPFVKISLVLTFLLFPHWSKPEWWNDVLSIMPNLLGFSLGGYAMWMAIGDDEFRKLISGEDDDGEPSPYMEVNAAFVHFIFLQIIAILLAIFAKAYYFRIPSTHWLADFIALGIIFYFICYFVFIYALASAVAATLALLQVSSWYDLKQTKATRVLQVKLKLEQHNNLKSKISKLRNVSKKH